MKLATACYRKKSALQAFTLVELLVGMGLASILMTAVMSLMFYTSRSFASLANYVDLDAQSKSALDRMTSEIRQVRRLTTGSDTRLVFEDHDGGSLMYIYNPRARSLMRVKNGKVDASPLLTQCDSVKFSLFKRNPIKGAYDQYPVTKDGSDGSCKLIQVRWTCSRDMIYAKWNTESILSAKIVIRNNVKLKAGGGAGSI